MMASKQEQAEETKISQLRDGHQVDQGQLAAKKSATENEHDGKRPSKRNLKKAKQGKNAHAERKEEPSIESEEEQRPRKGKGGPKKAKQAEKEQADY